MGVTYIKWPKDPEDGQRDRCTLATSRVLDLSKDLIGRFRLQRAPMPLVVLQAEEPDPAGRVTEIVEVLHGVFGEGRLLCQRPGAGHPPGSVDGLPGSLQHYHRALEMARGLAEPSQWDNHDRCQYKPYAFPRSRILAAIENAVGTGSAAPTAGEVLEQLHKRRWRRVQPASSAARWVFHPLLSPSTLAGALILAAASQVLAQAARPVLVGFLLGGLLLLVAGQMIYQNWARLSWLGAASHWFATTTFLAPIPLRPATRSRRRWPRLGPRRSWQVTQARARLVAEQLILARYGGVNTQADLATRTRALQFCLQLRVLALLEDLRAEHRRWALDLRGRKRTCPPMVFAPDADYDNGGLTLLAAISDVRSRRSEIDPVLVLASVPHGVNIEHVQIAGMSSGMLQETDGDLYAAWARQMRVGQSPSLGSSWPWMMRLPLRADRLGDQASDKVQPRAARSPWLLWSRWTLAAAVLALGITGVVRNDNLAHTYCSGGLIKSDHDLVWSPQSPSQCVGIDTSATQQFVPADGGVRLNGALPGQSGASRVGANITLAAVEDLVRQQNALADGAPHHITVVYAGPLTSATTGTGELQALGGLKELAGVYAWQYHVNKTLPTKMRVDIANGGQDLVSEGLMAQKIAVAARQDPTIDGVIGMGRDTPGTIASVQILADAGLAVVDTTNSSDSLGTNFNYFGLTATNKEEANSLARYTSSAETRTAIVFTRPGADPYSHEQAKASASMLRAHGFKLLGGGPLTYPVSNNQASFETNAIISQVCHSRVHPSVIYLAGRSDDLPGLMGLLQDDSTCFTARIILLSGDDLAKSELTDPSTQIIPSYVKVFYAEQTGTSRTGPRSNLAQYTEAALHLAGVPSYQDPYFADDFTALAFDAAHALYSAATAASSRYAVPSVLRCLHFTHGATGPIWFNGAHHGNEVVKVTGDRNEHPHAKIVSHSTTTGFTCP